MPEPILPTHPWITFSLDLARAQPELWLRMGEAQSKVLHIAGAPLLPDIQTEFLQVYLAKGVLATTAIEGNTLSEKEVLAHLEGNLQLPPSKEYMQQEIQNILDACNEIGPRVISGETADLSAGKLKRYNAMVLRGLSVSEEVEPGVFRRHDVGVAGYQGVPWQEIQQLTQRLCQLINFEVPSSDGFEIAFGVLRAILAHLYIAWIHPFGDGNGRTARLVELEILLSVGVPNVAAHLLSNHYNQTRSEYYRQLDRASRSRDPLPFFIYALQGFVDGLRDQVDTIKRQQQLVHWINFIHEHFKDNSTNANTRRKRLAIDMTFSEKPVPFSNVRHLSIRLAEAYAGKTDKTVRRDLNFLENMKLIKRTQDGYETQIQRILAFLPSTRSDSTNETTVSG